MQWVFFANVCKCGWQERTPRAKEQCQTVVRLAFVAFYRMSLLGLAQTFESCCATCICVPTYPEKLGTQRVCSGKAPGFKPADGTKSKYKSALEFSVRVWRMVA